MSELSKAFCGARYSGVDVIDLLDEHFFNKIGIKDYKDKAIILALVAMNTDGFKTLREPGSPKKLNQKYGYGLLGNEKPDDGDRFRGRGFFRRTFVGRTKYRDCAYALSKDVAFFRPDEIINDIDLALQIAVWQWTQANPYRFVEGRNLIVLSGIFGISITEMDQFKKTIIKIKDALEREMHK